MLKNNNFFIIPVIIRLNCTKVNKKADNQFVNLLFLLLFRAFYERFAAMARVWWPLAILALFLAFIEVSGRAAGAPFSF